jgi:uncharacterized protein (DUF1778 family)
VGTKSHGKARKSPDLTIRLTAKERRLIDRRAAALHERGVSSWARRVLIREASRETDEQRDERVRRFLEALQSGSIPGAREHADAVERTRRRWTIGDP